MLAALLRRVSSAFRPTIPRPTVVREPAAAYVVREARRGDREGAFTLTSGVRSLTYAVSVAAHADLNQQPLCGCGCGQVVRCWVATDRAGEIVGLVALTEALACIGLNDLLVAPEWRNRGVGGALLREAQQLADGYGIPIIALVRGSDVRGLRWLCAREFVVGQFESGGAAIRPEAFSSESRPEGYVLFRQGACPSEVRIHE